MFQMMLKRILMAHRQEPQLKSVCCLLWLCSEPFHSECHSLGLLFQNLV